MVYRRFLIYFTLLGTLGYGALMLFTFYKFQGNYESLWIEKSYEKKEAYATSITTPKLILGGGSGVHFSLNAQQLEVHFGIPVVNLGMHAGMGAKYLFHRLKKNANEGDTLLIALEYGFYGYRGEFHHVGSRYYLTYDKAFFWSLSPQEQWGIVRAFTPYDTFRAIRYGMIPLKEFAIGKGYTSKSINRNGDETYKPVIDRKVPIQAFMFGRACEDREIIHELQELKRWADQKGVRVIMSFPAREQQTIYATPKYQAFFKSIVACLNREGFEVLGSPEAFFYPDALFYDAPAHLNEKGATIHTKRMQGYLESHLKEGYLRK